MFLSSHLWAQNVQVTGQVTDEAGEPIPGATVLVKGTTAGTATDLDGQYQLSVPTDAVLVFSFIGYQPQEVEVDNRAVIDIVLISDFS